jgi:hypothetical protein
MLSATKLPKYTKGRAILLPTEAQPELGRILLDSVAHFFSLSSVIIFAQCAPWLGPLFPSVREGRVAFCQLQARGTESSRAGGG